MKRIILNLACAISLLAVGFSFWVITSPITASALGGAKANCQGGGTVTCQLSGSNCDAHDPTPEANGWCECLVDGHVEVFKSCNNPDDRDPPILD